MAVMKEKVFVLGAGRGQLPIIEICQKRNFETIVVSIDGNYPGFDYADRFYKVDIRDKEKILELAKQENIVGIMTDQVDIGVPSVAYVAEKMGLPGNGYDCSLKFTNKEIMREAAQRLGVKVPSFTALTKVEDACEAAKAMGFPVVIKPADCDGSRGVFKINNCHELISKFERSLGCSKVKKVMLEQFISGPEYNVQGFAYDFNHVNLIIGCGINFDIPNLFIPKTRIYKDSNSANPVEKKILEIHDRLVKGFGLRFGNTAGEYIVEEHSGEIYLVEVSARGGGVFISSDLIPLACGINVNELLVDYATNRIKDMDLALGQGASSYHCFTLPVGRIRSIKNVNKVLKIPGVHKVYLDTIQVGQWVEEMKDKSMRLGPILIFGEDEESCLNAFEQVKETLIIEVDTAVPGRSGIIW